LIFSLLQKFNTNGNYRLKEIIHSSNKQQASPRGAVVAHENISSKIKHSPAVGGFVVACFLFAHFFCIF
jgi:hypothetical protein